MNLPLLGPMPQFHLVSNSLAQDQRVFGLFSFRALIKMQFEKGSIAILFALCGTASAVLVDLSVVKVNLQPLIDIGHYKPAVVGTGPGCGCGEEAFTFNFDNFDDAQYITTISTNNLFVKAIGQGEAFTPDVNFIHQPPGGAARIFDSSNPTPGDLDLGSPNDTCGGPGVGVAGEINKPGENCVPQKNVLIVQRREKVNPDDAEGGGSFYFTLDPSTQWRLIALAVLDQPLNARVTITTTNRFDGDQFTSYFDGLGPNAYQAVSLFEGAPIRYNSEFRVDFPEDGAIAWIKFCQPVAKLLPVNAVTARRVLRQGAKE
jgi:hypothetical protein